MPSASRSGVKAYRLLFCDGLQRNMMTQSIVENKKCQKASSIHRSRQSGILREHSFGIFQPKRC